MSFLKISSTYFDLSNRQRYFLYVLEQCDDLQVDHNFNSLPSNFYVCRSL